MRTLPNIPENWKDYRIYFPAGIHKRNFDIMAKRLE